MKPRLLGPTMLGLVLGGGLAAGGPPAIAAPSALSVAPDPALTLTPAVSTPVGVPDFFVSHLDVPPFLLPIYQAAGDAYDVPWQALAAINQFETNFGRDLSVSSAGAVGWMQILPQTWSEYAVDANGDGVKDPYNPADAIFTAARFLHAAGGSQNIVSALSAYNHTPGFADSVMLRADLIGGIPSNLLGSLTGLSEGVLPVRGAASYTDSGGEAVEIEAPAGAPVVAATDGVILALASSPTLGRYLMLRDAFGNTYTYVGLRTLAKVDAPAQLAGAPVANRQLRLASDPAPHGPASAGAQRAPANPTIAPPVSSPSAPKLAVVAIPGATAFARLFAALNWPAPFGPGVRQPGLSESGARPPKKATPPTAGAGPADLEPLRVGAHVLAGAVLGRIEPARPGGVSDLTFGIHPAGTDAPQIDPAPILDQWRLLGTAVGSRSTARSRVLGPAASPTVGGILRESLAELEQEVLADPSIGIDAADRSEIQAGGVDQRVLAALDYLTVSGLEPTVAGLLGAGTTAGNAPSPSGTPATGVDISAINGTPILGHQGAGSIADVTIRYLLSLPGSFQPQQIVSLMSYPSTANTLAMPDHADQISVVFAPDYDPSPLFGQAADPVLTPAQWVELSRRVGQLGDPTVPDHPAPRSGQ